MVLKAILKNSHKINIFSLYKINESNILIMKLQKSRFKYQSTKGREARMNTTFGSTKEAKQNVRGFVIVENTLN